MDKKKKFFSDEYFNSSETSEIDGNQDETTPEEVINEDEKYELSKPRRRVIKAEIIRDRNN